MVILFYNAIRKRCRPQHKFLKLLLPLIVYWIRLHTYCGTVSAWHRSLIREEEDRLILFSNSKLAGLPPGMLKGAYCWWTNSRMTFITALDMRCNPRSPSLNIESCCRPKMSMKQLMIESWPNKVLSNQNLDWSDLPKMYVDKKCQWKFDDRILFVFALCNPRPPSSNIEMCENSGSPRCWTGYVRTGAEAQ